MPSHLHSLTSPDRPQTAQRARTGRGGGARPQAALIRTRRCIDASLGRRGRAGGGIDPTGSRTPGCTLPLCGTVTEFFEPIPLVDATDPLGNTGVPGVDISRGLSFIWVDPVLPTKPDFAIADMQQQTDYFSTLLEVVFQRSLADGVDTYYRAEDAVGDPTAEARRLHFFQMGLDRGVDDNVAP